MKSESLFLRYALYTVAALTAMTLLGLELGCQRPQVMHAAASVPAGQGTVVATAGPNGNTNLEVKVEHLAPASRVVADATTYVVWIEPRNGVRQNIGALTLNENLMGTLTTVTTHRSFLLMVTPEASGQVERPANEPVFSAEVNRSE